MAMYHMTTDQQVEWMDLAERCTHQDTMRFSALDAVTLKEYEALSERLDREATIDSYLEG